MSDADWELLDALIKTLHKQTKRMDELEKRVAQLEQSRRTRATGVDVFDERPVLHIPDPEPQPPCDHCPLYHSPELPCPTPVESVR